VNTPGSHGPIAPAKACEISTYLRYHLPAIMQTSSTKNWIRQRLIVTVSIDLNSIRALEVVRSAVRYRHPQYRSQSDPIPPLSWLPQHVRSTPRAGSYQILLPPLNLSVCDRAVLRAVVTCLRQPLSLCHRCPMCGATTDSLRLRAKALLTPTHFPVGRAQLRVQRSSIVLVSVRLMTGTCIWCR
jgi:hypothetical protein